MVRYGNEPTSSDPDHEFRIELERDEIAFGSERPPRSSRPSRRRFRRFLEPVLFAAAACIVLLATHTSGGEQSPAARRAPPASPSQSPRLDETLSTSRAQLLLIAAQTAVPGERITVLAYRNRRLCGAAELRFDGVPAAQQLVRYAGRLDPDYAEMFLTMDVPKSAKPGRHMIELYGPRPGGRGPICGDVPEHQGWFATTTISVGSPHR
jgi:hypothetical protein